MAECAANVHLGIPLLASCGPLSLGRSQLRLAMLHRELLLWRQNQRLTSVDCEIEYGNRVPDRYSDNAGAANRVSELEAHCNERYDNCQGCPHRAKGLRYGRLMCGKWRRS